MNSPESPKPFRLEDRRPRVRRTPSDRTWIDASYSEHPTWWQFSLDFRSTTDPDDAVGDPLADDLLDHDEYDVATESPPQKLVRQAALLASSYAGRVGRCSRAAPVRAGTALLGQRRQLAPSTVQRDRHRHPRPGFTPSASYAAVRIGSSMGETRPTPSRQPPGRLVANRRPWLRSAPLHCQAHWDFASGTPVRLTHPQDTERLPPGGRRCR